MNKVLAIIGAGHLGQQIANYAIEDLQYNSVLFFDDFSQQTLVAGHEVRGTSQKVRQEFDKGAFDEILIGIGYNHLDIRKSLYDQLSLHIPFGKIIHSSCWIDPSSEIRDGSVIYPGCVIDANATIGFNTILNLACTVAHDSNIGAHSFLAPRVAVAGFVQTGDKCFFGINTTLIDNITIAAGTRTGAGTVITKSVVDSGLYIGTPHKKIRE